MVRQPHPSHDRKTFVRVAVCSAFAIAGLATAGVSLNAGAEPWLPVLGGLGFLASCAVLVGTPLNICACPTCADRLSRCADSTEFVCARCGVAWLTKFYGKGIRG